MTRRTVYGDLELILQDMGAQLGVAETHGILTGILSLSPSIQDSVLREILLTNLDCASINKKDWILFKKLATQIVSDFNKGTVIFQLFLPDDNADLGQRIEALGAWCRGYLNGLALVGLSNKDLQNEVINELVNDLAQIARISIESAASEEDEINYMELVEYLRIAVQNIQIELCGKDRQMLH